MHRNILIISVVLIGGIAGAREAAPFRAGSQPDAKKSSPQPDARGKIIEEIRSDLDAVVGQLNKNDPGAQTRAKQRRIIDKINELLDQDDPSPPNPSADSSPPKPSNPPPAQAKPESSAKPSAEQKPQESPPAPRPKNAEMVGNKGERDALPRTAEELQKANAKNGSWGDMPWRSSPEMDTFARQRFMLRYEDLLREYYRSLAESGRREGRD